MLCGQQTHGLVFEEEEVGGRKIERCKRGEGGETGVLVIVWVAFCNFVTVGECLNAVMNACYPNKIFVLFRIRSRISKRNELIDNAIKDTYANFEIEKVKMRKVLN